MKTSQKAGLELLDQSLQERLLPYQLQLTTFYKPLRSIYLISNIYEEQNNDKT